MNTKPFIEKLKGDRRNNVKDFFNIIETCEIKNYSDILKAAYVVYESGIAFQPGVQPYKNWKYDKLCEDISNYIYEYFISKDIDFDCFHNCLCKKFISLSGNKYNYGNAQKFINMLFKYLACFKDVEEYEDKFENCHIPLDSHILKVLSTKDGIDICKNKSWVKLNESDYLEIVAEYRKTLKIKNGLEYDFDFWN